MSDNEPIAKTISRFNEKFKGFEKDSVNPHFKNKYVSLDGVLRAIMPTMRDVGLYLTQYTSVSDDGSAVVCTEISNDSGDILSGSLPIILDKNNSQGLGSALTYNRRYAVCLMLNLIEMEDDDGNQASQSPPEPPPYEGLSEEQVIKIREFADGRLDRWEEPPYADANDCWRAANEDLGFTVQNKPKSTDYDRIIEKIRELTEEGL